MSLKTLTNALLKNDTAGLHTQAKELLAVVEGIHEAALLRIGHGCILFFTEQELQDIAEIVRRGV